MKSIKKLLSIILSVIFLVSSFPANNIFASEASETILQEDFNSIITGGVPENSIKAVIAGNADAGVVEIPDVRNKSIYLRGAADGYATLTAPVLNPDSLPLTLSFRFMAKDKAVAVFPAISDTDGNSVSVLTLNNNSVSIDGAPIAEVKPSQWHYVEVTMNFAEHTYRVSVDGTISSYRFSLPEGELDEISFNIGGNSSSAIYIDDICLRESTIGGSDRISFPSKLWTTDLQQQVVDDISLSNLTLFNKSRVAYKNGQKFFMTSPVKELDTDLYVPLRFTAEKLGAEVVWNEEQQAVYIMFAGKTTRVKDGEIDIYSDSSASSIEKPILTFDGVTYIKAEDLGTILNHPVTTGDGYIMYGSDWDYYERSEQRVREELYRMVKYERPSGEELYNTFISNNKGKGKNGENRHPRIYGTAEDFDRIRTAYNNGDKFTTDAVKFLLKTADGYLNEPLWTYELGKNAAAGRCYNDSVIEKVIGYCAMAYQISGDEKYAARAKAELLNLASFPEMGVTTMLDMGDSSNMLGFGYDWLYDYLTVSERKVIRDAIVNKVFDPVMYCYQGNGTAYTYEGMTHTAQSIRRDWVYSPYNWNIHINHGVLMSLFAIADEDFTNGEVDKYIKPLLGYIFRSLEFFFDEFYPDGAWQEGPGYGMACVGATCIIVDSIRKSLGSDFGFLAVSGVKEAILWAQHVKAPVALFNYADSDELLRNTYDDYLLLAGDLLNDGSLVADRKQQLEQKYFTQLDFRELLWYKPELVTGTESPEELDAYFRKVETTTMRSGWGLNDLFLGFHSGLNGINHAQIDTGSFVFDWNNVRWVSDIGIDKATSHWYDAAADWGTGYRERAEGHNTIVIDDTPYYSSVEGQWPAIISDDFENYTVGSDPSIFKINEEGSLDGKAKLDIVNAPTAENPNNKAFRMELHKENKNAGFAQYSFGQNHVNKVMEIGFKFKLAKFDEASAMDFINIHSVASGDLKAKTNFAFQIGVGGNLKVVNGTGHTQVIKLDPSTWYDIRLIFNIQTCTMDVYVDNVLKVKDAKIKSQPGPVDYVRFQLFERDFDAYMDDFSIKVHPDEKDVVLSAARLYDQTLYCNSPITKYESKPAGALAITDMTQAYNKWVSSARRGVMLTNLRNAFVVRDEITLNSKSDVYWFAHSSKKVVDKITIASDGQSAILENTASASRVWVQILEGGTNGKLEVMECVPLPGSPTPSNQANNSGRQKLAVKLEGVEGDVSLAVAFIPLKVGEAHPAEIPENSNLDSWQIPDGEIPKLDSLMINGELVDNFEPAKTTYIIPIRDDAGVPVVSASAFGKAVDNITQAQSVPGVAQFTLEKDGNKVTYTVNFTLERVSRTTIQGYPITEDFVMTSSFQEQENPPKNALDGSIDTRFTAYGKDEWIMFDFQKPCTFSKLDIAWYWGAQRKYNFEIQCSNDTNNWETVFKGESCGTTGDFETYIFDKTVNAQFIRIVGYGSDKSLYNNFAEVR